MVQEGIADRQGKGERAGRACEAHAEKDRHAEGQGRPGTWAAQGDPWGEQG